MTNRTYQEHASELIAECYHALLQRAPDLEGMREKAARIVDGQATLQQIIKEIISSEEFMVRLPGLLAQRIPGPGCRLTNDVSQCGEVWLLLRHWVNAQAAYGVVVDVGARGRERSNSYDLMRHFGWRGLLVEANPALLEAIKRDFTDCDMRLISCAVSDYVGKATFTLGANDDVSSLDAGLAKGWGETRGEVMVNVRRLVDVLDENDVPFAFDLLSLDIEGEDIKVFNDLIENSAYRPRWVIIEASHGFKVRTLEDAPFSTKVRAHYEVRMATHVNLILERSEADRAEWQARSQTAESRATRNAPSVHQTAAESADAIVAEEEGATSMKPSL